MINLPYVEVSARQTGKSTRAFEFAQQYVVEFSSPNQVLVIVPSNEMKRVIGRGRRELLESLSSRVTIMSEPEFEESKGGLKYSLIILDEFDCMENITPSSVRERLVNVDNIIAIGTATKLRLPETLRTGFDEDGNRDNFTAFLGLTARIVTYTSPPSILGMNRSRISDEMVSTELKGNYIQ